MILVRNIYNLCKECSRNRQLHFWRAWWCWSCGISSLNQITLIFGIVIVILCKSVIHDFGPKICNLCRECSRYRQLHFWRAWCRWNRGISSLNQITLIFEIVTFILYKSVIHDFGPKFMKPLQRVFSKQVTPLWASMVPLESRYILNKPNNTHI